MTNEKLSILVVDDQEINLRSIDELVEAGHEVDTARSFVEASKKILRAKGSDYGEHLRKFEGVNKAQGGYDVILTDLNFPLGGESGELVNIANDSYERHQESPLGYSLLFLAAHKGTQNVAVVSNMNHHDGAIAASFDLLYGCVPPNPKLVRPTYQINDTNVMMFDSDDLPRVERDGMKSKNWKAALDKLYQNDKGE